MSAVSLEMLKIEQNKTNRMFWWKSNQCPFCIQLYLNRCCYSARAVHKRTALYTALPFISAVDILYVVPVHGSFSRPVKRVLTGIRRDSSLCVVFLPTWLIWQLIISSARVGVAILSPPGCFALQLLSQSFPNAFLLNYPYHVAEQQRETASSAVGATSL